MSDKKKRRQKVNTEKVSQKMPDSLKQNILMILVILVILVYVVVECFSVINVQLHTETATATTVYDTISTKALVVRDEKVITGDSSGVTVPSVSDGEKVKNGGTAAMSFKSADDAQKYSKYLDYKSKMEYYANLETQAVGKVSDVDSIDKDIIADVNDYVRSLSSVDLKEINTYSEALNDKFTRRQMLIGEEIDFSSVVKELQSNIDDLGISSCKPTEFITVDESGIFSSYVDDKESSFDYGKIKDIDSKTLNGYIDEAKNAKADSKAVGKMITSFDWYFCCEVDAESVAGLKDGQKIDVTLKDSDNVLPCKIISGADTSYGAKTTVLVLMCNEMNSEIASLRYEDIEIRVKSYTGIKVPLDSVHVSDGKKGVYTLVSSVVEWREANIIYSGDDYVVLSYDQDNKNGIRLYDQIITQGKDLYDGKVYT